MKKNLLLLFNVLTVTFIGFTQTYNFTNAGAIGDQGPTQLQINAAYLATNLNGLVTINTQGIQEWTVPSTGTYLISTIGACGGEGQGTYYPGLPGTGATIQGEFYLTAGTVLNIVVGQKGIYADNGSGGGGGSFVYSGTPGGAGLMIVAGGGGGHGHGDIAYPTGAHGGGGSATTSQVNSPVGNGDGGSGGIGNGGNSGTGCSFAGVGAGGAGWLSSGQNATCGTAIGGSNLTFVGGYGGTDGLFGGFGGGGGSDGNGSPGGGGGGYTGGGGGNTYSGEVWGAGAGAGSFNNGSNQINTAGVSGAVSGYSDGSVTITQTCTVASITPDLATLADVTSTCSLGSLVAPTGLTNCGVIVTATTTQNFPITTIGTTAVTWTYTSGSIVTSQTQNVIISPTSITPDLATLADVTSMCSVGSLAAPTGVTDCGSTVIGSTTQIFPITAAGTTVVTWTYTSGSIVSTQTQNVIINLPVSTVTLTEATLQADCLVAAYQWLNCDNGNSVIVGEVNQSYTPTLSGYYSVEVTQGGCSDTSACIFVDFTGLAELNQNDIQLYPNPNNGIFTLALPINDSYLVHIYDLTGKLVYSDTEYSTNVITLNISNLENGTYTVQLKNDYQLVNKRIVIQK
jgi:hypothetical protein